MKRVFFRRIFTLIFTLMFCIVCFVPVFAVSSGDCGASVNWSFDESTGELTISGSGAMADYNEADDAPWVNFKDKILKITVTEGVTTIGRYAFNSCTGVSEISLPEGLTTIGFGSFDSCSSLKSIYIPSTVKIFHDSPFFNCTGLETITVSDANNYFCTDNDSVLYSKDKTELIQYPCGRQSANFILPYTVTSINKAAFAGSGMLVNVIIPESTKIIDSMAFYGCTSLQIVSVPKSIDMIGEKAFYKCDNLSEIYYAGNQDDWTLINIRNDNENLSEATFEYEAKGPDSVSEDMQITTTQPVITTQPSINAAITPEKIAEKREFIPIIIIAIAVIIVILFIVLIKVAVTKKPNREKK